MTTLKTQPLTTGERERRRRRRMERRLAFVRAQMQLEQARAARRRQS
jgi:hypothetical protein